MPFIREWGDGPTVLFIHGLAGSTRYWDSVAGAGTGFRGVAVDLIGFGKSPKPHDFSYDVEAQVDAVRSVCPNPDVVVGHSIGAIIAAAFVRRSMRPTPTLLVGAPAYRTAADAEAYISELGWMAGATIDGTRMSRSMCALMCTFRPIAMLVAPMVRRDVPAAVAIDAVRHTWPSYSETVRCVLMEHRIDRDVSALTGPTIAIHGSADRVAPIGRVAELAASLPHVELRTVEGGDHHLALSQPKRITDAINDVLG